MSRSNPEGERLINPANRFFQFKGDDGIFQYYDKELDNPKTGKKGMNISIPLPFTFIVLDILSTITGYSDAKKGGFYSNEVRNVKTDKLFVRCGKEKYEEGLWADIKGKDSSMDYAASVYIAYMNANKELTIGHIKMSGACLSAWIEFIKLKGSKEVYANAICVIGCSDHKKGKVDYKMPIFTLKPIKAETNQKALELDLLLQDYLKNYFANGSNVPKPTPEEEAKLVAPVVLPEETPEPVMRNRAAQQAVNDFVTPEDDLPF